MVVFRLYAEQRRRSIRDCGRIGGDKRHNRCGALDTLAERADVRSGDDSAEFLSRQRPAYLRRMRELKAGPPGATRSHGWRATT